jgi:hypothetical protein
MSFISRNLGKLLSPVIWKTSQFESVPAVFGLSLPRTVPTTIHNARVMVPRIPVFRGSSLSLVMIVE